MKKFDGLVVVVHILALCFFCAESSARKTIFAGGDDVLTIYGEENFERFGTDLETCDINGDGVADIVASATMYEDPVAGRFERGAIYVFYGRADHQWPIDLRLYPGDLVVHGAEDSDRAGSNLGCADFDGDGFDDIFIAASAADGQNNARMDSGEIFIFYGRTDLRGVVDLAVDSPDTVICGADENDIIAGLRAEETTDRLAFGDINDDGIKDFVLGCPNGDGPSNAGDLTGEVYVFLGGTRLPAVVDLVMTAASVRIYGFQD